MTSNSGAPNRWRLPPPLPPPLPRGGYRCYLCGKWWPTVPTLGGHMSSRRCANKRRRRQDDAPVGPWLLAPNRFFWEEYRHEERPPVEINFLGLLESRSWRAPAPQPVMDHEDAEPQVIDLTLRL
ncbi:hypothetical protein ACQJBY_058335 [Aegilops geniculata]